MLNNRLEALREKGMAEKMISSKDYVGARDRILRAQEAFPDLDKVASMLAVCDILSASQTNIPGSDIDYYWVLHLNPTSTESDVKFRYHKLVIMLQPIKNSFPGTELALKLVEDAYSVLSDKHKRDSFNSRRSCIWDTYESLNLRECSVNLEGGHSWSQNIAPLALDQDFCNFNDTRKIENLKPGQIWARNHYSGASQNLRYARILSNEMSVVRVSWLEPVPVSVEERRWYEAGLPVACGSFYLNLEASEQLVSPMAFSYISSWVPGIAFDQIDIYPRKGEVWALYEDWDIDEWSCHPEAIKQDKFKLVELLSDFSKYIGADGACLVKVDGFRSIYQRQMYEGMPVNFHIFPVNLYMLSHKVPAHRFFDGEINGVIEGMLELDLLALPDDNRHQMNGHALAKEEDSDAVTPADQAIVSNTSPILESEVLSNKWLIKDIVIGQIWAVYCGRDSMPRQYIYIDHVISATQVCVTFLEPQPRSDCEISWKKGNLPFVCGTFRAGGTKANLETTQLSHPVDYELDMPVFKIQPLTGEIWAIYQGWTSEWKQEDFYNCQYWIVEVLSDLSEGENILVTRLTQVKGCLTFFHREKHDGFDLVRAIAETDMLSFSHRVPAFRVPGIGRHGIPESSWHLEPNALPQLQ